MQMQHESVKILSVMHCIARSKLGVEHCQGVPPSSSDAIATKQVSFGSSTAVWWSTETVTIYSNGEQLVHSLSHLIIGRHIWPGCTACDRELLQG